jgi:hypothetical protein
MKYHEYKCVEMFGVGTRKALLGISYEPIQSHEDLGSHFPMRYQSEYITANFGDPDLTPRIPVQIGERHGCMLLNWDRNKNLNAACVMLLDVLPDAPSMILKARLSFMEKENLTLDKDILPLWTGFVAASLPNIPHWTGTR